MERDIYHTNDELKRAGVAILILDKVNFKRKSIIKDKEGHTIKMKGSTRREDVTITGTVCPTRDRKSVCKVCRSGKMKERMLSWQEQRDAGVR